MKTGQHKSLPENQKANNTDEKDKCVNGPQGDAAVAKETPVTADQQQQPPDQEASANHTADHTQPSAASPEEVELKITEPDRPEAEPVPAVCSVAEKPAVCPERPPAPDIQPIPTDAGIETDANKPSTEVLFVSEEGDDVMRPKNEPTTRTEQITCTIGTNDVHVQKDDEQQKDVKVGDIEPPKPVDDVVASPDAEVLQTSSSPVVDATSTVEAPAVTDEADHASSTMTGGTDDHQRQTDIDVVVQAPAAEATVAASAVDQQESAPPPPEGTQQVLDTAPVPSQQPDAECSGEHLFTQTAPLASEADQPMAREADHASSAMTAGTDDHQKQTDTDVVVEAPVAETNAASVVDQQQSALPPPPEGTEQAEQVPDSAVLSDQTMISADTSPAPSDQLNAEHQDEHLSTSTPSEAAAATDSVEPDVEANKCDEPGEQPATDGVQATTEQTTVAHEVHPAAEESKDVDATNTPVTESSSDAAALLVDDSAWKPEGAASSSVTQDDVGDIQPEELPPPLTPEKEDAAASANDELQQAPASACYVEPTSDASRQEQQAVNDSVENVEESTHSKSTSEAADHVGELMPVAGQP